MIEVCLLTTGKVGYSQEELSVSTVVSSLKRVKIEEGGDSQKHPEPTCGQSALPWALQNSRQTLWLPARSPSKQPHHHDTLTFLLPSLSCLPNHWPATTSPPIPPAKLWNKFHADLSQQKKTSVAGADIYHFDMKISRCILELR